MINRILAKLEEYKYSHLVEHDSERIEHCKEQERNCDGADCFLCIWDKAIEIVQEVAKEYKPQTNADRIRSMNDEELAEFLKKFDLCTNCKYGEDVRCTFGNPCTHGFATAMAYEWLKSEAKE